MKFKLTVYLHFKKIAFKTRRYLKKSIKNQDRFDNIKSSYEKDLENNRDYYNEHLLICLDIIEFNNQVDTYKITNPVKLLADLFICDELARYLSIDKLIEKIEDRLYLCKSYRVRGITFIRGYTF